jgi:hypothetical protein
VNQQRVIILMGALIVCLVAILSFMIGQQNPNGLNIPSAPSANIEQIASTNKASPQVEDRKDKNAVGQQANFKSLVREDLIGTWAAKSSGCATDDTLQFQRQGSYQTYGTEGRWSLNGDTINVFISREMTGESDENYEDIWKSNKPEKKYSYKTKRINSKEISINREVYIRC